MTELRTQKAKGAPSLQTKRNECPQYGYYYYYNYYHYYYHYYHYHYHCYYHYYYFMAKIIDNTRRNSISENRLNICKSLYNRQVSSIEKPSKSENAKHKYEILEIDDVV